RTRTPMTIDATIDVRSLNADVLRSWASIAPPFSRSKQTNDRSARSDGQVRRSGVAPHINTRPFRERIKRLQREIDWPRPSACGSLLNGISECCLARTGGHERCQTVTGPQGVGQFTEPVGTPEFGRPTATGIQDRITSGVRVLPRLSFLLFA